MQENFDVIFSEVENYVKSTLAKKDCISKENGSGAIDFRMHLDDNGNGSYEVSQRGWGVTISTTAIVLEPSGTFDLEVYSSDGGGGKWSNLHTGERVSCQIKTSFLHPTTIRVSVHSSARNCAFVARLDYNY